MLTNDALITVKSAPLVGFRISAYRVDVSPLILAGRGGEEIASNGHPQAPDNPDGSGPHTSCLIGLPASKRLLALVTPASLKNAR